MVWSPRAAHRGQHARSSSSSPAPLPTEGLLLHWELIESGTCGLRGTASMQEGGVASPWWSTLTPARVLASNDEIWHVGEDGGGHPHRGDSQ